MLHACVLREDSKDNVVACLFESITQVAVCRAAARARGIICGNLVLPIYLSIYLPTYLSVSVVHPPPSSCMHISPRVLKTRVCLAYAWCVMSGVGLCSVVGQHGEVRWCRWLQGRLLWEMRVRRGVG